MSFSIFTVEMWNKWNRNWASSAWILKAVFYICPIQIRNNGVCAVANGIAVSSVVNHFSLCIVHFCLCESNLFSANNGINLSNLMQGCLSLSLSECACVCSIILQSMDFIQSNNKRLCIIRMVETRFLIVYKKNEKGNIFKIKYIHKFVAYIWWQHSSIFSAVLTLSFLFMIAEHILYEICHKTYCCIHYQSPFPATGNGEQNKEKRTKRLNVQCARGENAKNQMIKTNVWKSFVKQSSVI